MASKVASLGQALGLFIALGQVVAPDLVIVTQVDTTVGKRGVRPDEHPAGDLVSGLDEFGATQLLVAAWLKFGDDQLSKIISQKKPVTLFDGKDTAPAYWAFPAGSRECAPKLFPIRKPGADVSPAGAASINVSIHNLGGVLHSCDAPAGGALWWYLTLPRRRL